MINDPYIKDTVMKRSEKEREKKTEVINVIRNFCSSLRKKDNSCSFPHFHDFI